MFTVGRGRDQSIVIGDDILITVVDIREDYVRLGIDAPQGIPGLHQEVCIVLKEEDGNPRDDASGALIIDWQTKRKAVDAKPRTQNEL